VVGSGEWVVASVGVLLLVRRGERAQVGCCRRPVVRVFG